MPTVAAVMSAVCEATAVHITERLPRATMSSFSATNEEESKFTEALQTHGHSDHRRFPWNQA